VVFTAPQKWLDRLLASMPKSVRLLLAADAGRLAVAAEIQYEPNMSEPPCRDDGGGFQALRRRRLITQRAAAVSECGDRKLRDDFRFLKFGYV
jgi:hypothetical protein